MDGKVVLITGGTSGIGRAAASAFARAGARIVIAGRRIDPGKQAEEELRADAAEVRFVQADVSQARDVERLISSTLDAYGRLDAAFNNAATTDGALSLTADFTEEQFDRAIAMNLKSVWLCLRAEVRQMLVQSPAGGAIVNTSSVNGLGGAPGGALYSAAKAGVLALTKSAAQEYATRGIRVNALVAGGFRTPMLESVFETVGARHPAGPAAVEAQYTGLIPMGRIGRPEEAAEAAVWLCSDAASYVTGHSMIVDGGLTAGTR
jgi:NAD(P)-dependent dehydrogenase (short-subunit alcohol dehydrogenase family)